MSKCLVVAGALAVAIGAANTAYADNICPSDNYTGSGPFLVAGTTLCTDHPIYSQSRVYSFELQDPGALGEWRGSNVLVNANIAWNLSPNVPNNNYGPFAFIAQMQNDGNFVVYGPNSTSLAASATRSNQIGTGDYFANLNDNGAFQIFAGTPSSPGKQLYSNNVNNPVTGTTLTSLNYDVNQAQVTSLGIAAGGTYTAVNNTSKTQAFLPLLSLTHSDSQTFNWSLSEAISASITGSFQVGVPAVAENNVSITLGSTTTITNGDSTTSGDAVTNELQADIIVPPHSTYKATMEGQIANVDVPYSYTGTAHYQGGQTAAVSGTGMFDGVSTGDFSVIIDCVVEEPSCDGVSIPPESAASLGGVRQYDADVPEPASLALLGTGLFGLAVARRRQRRCLRPPRKA